MNKFIKYCCYILVVIVLSWLSYSFISGDIYRARNNNDFGDAPEYWNDDLKY